MGKLYSASEARDEFVAKTRAGWSMAKIAAFLDKSVPTLEWYLKDPAFKAEIYKARDYFQRRTDITETTLPEFPEFSERYLGMKLYGHHLQWHELLEGREPQQLHRSQTYIPGDENMILINTPPFHAKTTCISVNYVVWRIIQNPNIRVAIISKTQTRAKEILFSISERLSSKTRLFQDLKDDFGPPDGFDNNTVWTASRIYLSPEVRDSGEKDPTVQALGITQQLYGSRIDLMILDDCVDLSNAHLYNEQIAWIQSIASNRMDLATDGQIVIVGTRLMAQDLYSEIQKPTHYSEGESPWTYLTQPAVLEFDQDPENWVTLWPTSNRALNPMSARKKSKTAVSNTDGTFPAWPGVKLAKIKASTSAERWARIYQQQQVSDSTTFSPKDIDGCTNALRVAGPMVPDKRGHRLEGMSGLHVIAGLDPAAVNYTAAVCIGVDIHTGQRYVLDVFNKRETLPHEMNALIKHWTTLYGVREWQIETVGYQQRIVQDNDLLEFTRSRGVRLNPHITNKNKWDETYGVATMATLFKGWETGTPLIELPKRTGHFGVQSLCDQLVGWYPTPSRSAKAPVQDCVMALWFCEMRARELTNTHNSGVEFWDDGLLSGQDRENQIAVDLNEWSRLGLQGAIGYTNWTDEAPKPERWGHWGE